VPFAASSPQFSLAEMVEPPWADCVSIGGPSEAAARAYYAETQMALFTWSSLAGGFFSGRYRSDNLESLTERQDELVRRSYGSSLNLARLERARALASRKGRTLPQIALAYSQNHPLNLFSLVGCRTPAEFEDDLKALDTPLSEGEISWLECAEPSTTAEEL
jgi:aryl-alcohol dehydrogenase-like predicted oxidoreductase